MKLPWRQEIGIFEAAHGRDYAASVGEPVSPLHKWPAYLRFVGAGVVGLAIGAEVGGALLGVDSPEFYTDSLVVLAGGAGSWIVGAVAEEN